MFSWPHRRSAVLLIFFRATLLYLFIYFIFLQRNVFCVPIGVVNQSPYACTEDIAFAKSS